MKKPKKDSATTFSQFICEGGDILRFVAIESRISTWEDRHRAIEMIFDKAFKLGMKKGRRLERRRYLKTLKGKRR